MTVGVRSPILIGTGEQVDKRKDEQHMLNTSISIKTDVKVLSYPDGTFHRQAVAVTASVVGRDGVVRSHEVVGNGVNPNFNQLGKLIKKAVDGLATDVLVDSLC